MWWEARIGRAMTQKPEEKLSSKWIERYKLWLHNDNDDECHGVGVGADPLPPCRDGPRKPDLPPGQELSSGLLGFRQNEGALRNAKR